MSYYYMYKLGYITKDNKIYPIGPFDQNGNLHDVICDSRSFASDLWEIFDCVKDEQVTDELKTHFSYEDYNNEKIFDDNIKYLRLRDLPRGSWLKRGYFLIEDYERYIKNEEHYDEDIFYNYLPPEIYSAKLENELKFGKPEPKKDFEGEEIEQYSCSDYMFVTIPDYHSKEYDAFILRTVAEMYDYSNCVPEDAEIVVLETEG